MTENIALYASALNRARRENGYDRVFMTKVWLKPAIILP